MATSINVSKKSVADLLATGKDMPFIIPEYQRPYAWSTDEVETLFNDIWEFSDTEGSKKGTEFYFLGSIVSFENKDGEQEIIDGQQRITSLFLLLRAIYHKLINSDDVNSNEAQNFIRKIKPAIWCEDNITGEVDMSKVLLTSKVVDNEGNEIFRKILQSGEANKNSADNYSRNYIKFQELLDEFSKKAPLRIYYFIHALLKQAILLPINADSQDTALTIFSTLNNRGLPLSDADIFKAKIYNELDSTEKEEFIKQWKRIEREAAEANESIQGLFYYYMFYLRAVDGDTSSTTPGVRKYYLEKGKNRLHKDVLNGLELILMLWKVINCNHDIPDEDWDNNHDIRKALDTLTSYPNEYWKYPVVIFYLSHRKNNDFEEAFLLFLNKLIVELMTRFIVTPTINAVKTDIMKLDAKIVKDIHPDFDFKPMDMSGLMELIIQPHRNIIRMLLKCYAYAHQSTLLPDNWQIEHILPQKWQPTFFCNEDEEHINMMIEHIGNKTPFERKLNIQASNGYFESKKKHYSKSEIEVTKSLIINVNGDWTLSHITNRDKIIANDIKVLLSQFDEAYATGISKEETDSPSQDDLERIKEYKEKGWI